MSNTLVILTLLFRNGRIGEGRRKNEEERRKKEEAKVLLYLSFKFLICPNHCFDCYKNY
ncbi:hypothetical protein [Okeania sp. KiyG1]|uniref:hypothetical protein n=1 Tax=Okeania sp. KiyG1 TaxID=2720165 RepID=UPI0019220B86|nr:hypothetical protein [Okeania sp. KiyG1]